jgi:S1-C subfamily serine protease
MRERRRDHLPTTRECPRKLLAATLLLVLMSASLAACSDDDDSSTPAAGPTTTVTSVSAAVVTQDTDAATLDELPDVVQRVIPSVVAIRTNTGEGSGVVWDENGHVVTNNHVIAGASSITVVLATGRELDATLVGTDPVTDIALLDVDEQNLPAIDRAKTVPLVGTPVIAVGNPLGFESSVTFGVLSGLRRSIPGADLSLIDLIQTDAAISPGNSGGALVDLEGRLVGIAVAYIPPSGGAVSIGFAVPITTASSVAEQLEATGTVVHAYLGVNLAPITPDLSERFGLDATEGALVTTVEPGSPAAAAGIQAGDVIVGISGQEVNVPDDVLAVIRRSATGETVELKVQKGGKGDPETVSVQLAERPG